MPCLDSIQINNCYLQLIRGGSKIYEFDLKSTTAVQAGSDVVVKDLLSQFTFTSSLLTSLSYTIPTFIAYIEANRTICNATSSVPSSLFADIIWAYDTANGTKVLVKMKQDGTYSYESPVGTTYTPIGTIISELDSSVISTQNILNITTTVTALTVPVNAKAAYIHVSQSPLLYTVDSTNPNNTDPNNLVGVQVPAGGNITLVNDELTKFKAISLDGNPADLFITYKTKL